MNISVFLVEFFVHKKHLYVHKNTFFADQYLIKNGPPLT